MIDLLSATVITLLFVPTALQDQRKKAGCGLIDKRKRLKSNDMTTQELKQLNGPLYQECIGFALTLTGEKSLAMDLVQDTYYLANKHHHTFANGTNLSAWIKRILHNTFLSDYRRIKRRRELIIAKPPADSWIDRAIVDNPAVSTLGVEDLTCLINNVPALYRQSFIRLANGMTYQQIANSLNIPVGTVKSRVFTARKMLKERILNRRIA